MSAGLKSHIPALIPEPLPAPALQIRHGRHPRYNPPGLRKLSQSHTSHKNILDVCEIKAKIHGTIYKIRTDQEDVVCYTFLCIIHFSPDSPASELHLHLLQVHLLHLRNNISLPGTSINNHDFHNISTS